MCRGGSGSGGGGSRTRVLRCRRNASTGLVRAFYLSAAFLVYEQTGHRPIPTKSPTDRPKATGSKSWFLSSNEPLRTARPAPARATYAATGRKSASLADKKVPIRRWRSTCNEPHGTTPIESGTPPIQSSESCDHSRQVYDLVSPGVKRVVLRYSCRISRCNS